MKLRKVFPIIAMLMIVLIAGCNKKDDLTGMRPKVTSTDPISEATNIGISSKISAIFSVAMNTTTINATNFTVKEGTTDVSGTVGYTGKTATFTPAEVLGTSTLYTATISGLAQDASGLGLEKDYVWSFTTAGGPPDLTKPTVTVTDPLNSATGVSSTKLIKVTFSEAMDPPTITTLTYTLKQGSTSVPGAVTYIGTIATFTPTSNLAYSKDYTGTITTGAKDMAGNALASNFTFSFTTGNAPDLTLPMASSTSPLAGATGVALNGQVTITFSEEMDPATITSTSTFTLKQGAINVPGAVTYSGTTATFTPTNPLEGGKEYTATVTNVAKDLVGNPLGGNIVWKFTTLIPGPAAVNLRTAGNYVIFANTGIANPTGNSTITGNIGTGPGVTSTAITGFGLTLGAGAAFSTSPQVTGNIYASDYAVPTPTDVNTASNDMLTAYTDAAGRAPTYTPELYAGDISGKTLAPGVYKWSSSVVINTDVTLEGSDTDVWIFEISGDLTIAAGGTLPAGIKVLLSGGAKASNIFWQVGGPVGATLETYSTFNGNILSAKQVVMKTGAVMNGRALAQTQVVLDANAVTMPQ